MKVAIGRRCEAQQQTELRAGTCAYYGRYYGRYLLLLWGWESPIGSTPAIVPPVVPSLTPFVLGEGGGGISGGARGLRPQLT